MKNSMILVEQVHERVAAGAKILDVREYPEWVQVHIPGSELVPLGQLKGDPQLGTIASEVLVLCRTGRRASEAAQLLEEASSVKARVIEGGIEAWQRAGQEIHKAEHGPISMERQVRIGAGMLMLLGLLVPRLRVVSWFVPVGLIFAGITDHCGMAKVLSHAPWNQPNKNKHRGNRPDVPRDRT